MPGIGLFEELCARRNVNTGDEHVIEPIAKRFNSRAHPWHDAAKAGLIKLGPQAEEAILAILVEKPTARACEVLGVIGTKKSTNVLQKLLASKEFWIKKAAGDALGKIVKREG